MLAGTLSEGNRTDFPNSKLDFVLEQEDVRHHRDGIPQALIDRPGDNHSRDDPLLTQVHFDPTHIGRKLTKRSIRTPFELQFKYDEIAVLIHGEDVNWSDSGWKLHSRAPGSTPGRDIHFPVRLESAT